MRAQSPADDYALVLNDPPLAEQAGSRKELRSASPDRLARIQSSQQQVRQRLASRQIPVVGSAQTLVNAVFVRASKDQVAELKSLPNVKRVEYLPPMRHHLDAKGALDLIRTSGAWEVVGGEDKAGAGVKIGILDSGIDQTHPAFQDSSLPAVSGFPKGAAEFTNAKVIVARSYVSLLTYEDDDITPRDRFGFGTAVAMIAAGTRNSGPDATITGVAPKAYLGNYKIFGTPGINDTTRAPALIQALQDALNDGMDIVTVPLGSPATYDPLLRDSVCADATAQFGLGIPSDSCDVRAQAVENAVRLGLTVVVSAGDDGELGVRYPALNTINTPGTAPSAITVGASRKYFSTVRLSGDDAPSGLRQIDALFGDGPLPNGPLTAPLRDVSQLQNDGLACSGLPPRSLTGAIALIQRGNCPFVDKVGYARDAGAVGVVLYQLSGYDFIFQPLGLYDNEIPMAFIGNNAGVALKNFLGSNPGRQVTLDAALREVGADFDVVASFTSRGPSIDGGAIKPELVAPGTDLYTATQTFDDYGDLWSPSGYTVVDGASFAVPLVAGVAAMVKQRNPGFSPAQIKSAVVNTAVPEVNEDGATARVTSVGAGKLNATAAVAARATLEPATLSFGTVGSGTLPISRVVRITNTSDARATYNFAINARDTDSKAALAVSPSSLQLNPGQADTITVRLDGSTPAPGSYEGFLTVQGDAYLRVPYLYLVGDGTPYNAFAVRGDGFVGLVGQRDVLIAFKVIDRYGVPIQNAPVVFRVTRGSGRIACSLAAGCADAATDRLGIAGAFVTLGGQTGDQQFTAEVGGLTIPFNLQAVRQ